MQDECRIARPGSEPFQDQFFFPQCSWWGRGAHLKLSSLASRNQGRKSIPTRAWKNCPERWPPSRKENSRVVQHSCWLQQRTGFLKWQWETPTPKLETEELEHPSWDWRAQAASLQQPRGVFCLSWLGALLGHRSSRRTWVWKRECRSKPLL